MDKIKLFFRNHATKFIGFLSSSLGALSLVDATTVHLIEQVLGPHRGHQVTSAMMIIAGLGTAYRGFQNSKKP